MSEILIYIHSSTHLFILDRFCSPGFVAEDESELLTLLLSAFQVLGYRLVPPHSIYVVGDRDGGQDSIC